MDELTEQDAVEELLELWLREDPDPVDLLEDRLAAEVGLCRHPAMSREEWRRARIKAIDGSEREP